MEALSSQTLTFICDFRWHLNERFRKWVLGDWFKSQDIQNLVAEDVFCPCRLVAGHAGHAGHAGGIFIVQESEKNMT
jgi:hypothetical protein